MFFDMHHRPGNVHDSNGAVGFVSQCIERVRRRPPRAVLAAHLDSAFFHQNLLSVLEEHRVQYAVSLPFSNFTSLRHLVESRQRWCRIDDRWSYFETTWRPKRWLRKRRVILIRQRRAVQRKGPLQLDLFEVVDREFEYQAIVTNKKTSATNVLAFLLPQRPRLPGGHPRRGQGACLARLRPMPTAGCQSTLLAGRDACSQPRA